ncbi:hypothetical protein JCM24511_04036 [Saitozyma sp. JCM 24511]|nr:hypothetical protein JCM24511_04036 [Saitozyma sp. JCM 24511]
MPLARTPPQRATQLAQSTTPGTNAVSGDTAMASPSPSRAGPRPSSSGAGRVQPPRSSDDGTSALAPAAPVAVLGSPPRAVRNIPAELLPSSHTEEDTPMEVDEPAPIAAVPSVAEVPEVPEAPEVAEVVQPVAGPSTPGPKPAIASTTPRPFAQISSAPLATPAAAPAPVTPAPKTAPRSTRKTPAQSAQAAQVLDTPAVPIPGDILEYGRRWESTMNTLELAVRAGAQKWTARDLESCLPLLAKKNPEAMKDVWANSSISMRTIIMNHANTLMNDYKAGPALQLIEQVVDDAKAHAAKSSEPRPDAWRPDRSPFALTAATNLPIYDEAYARLREEYIHLHEDCSTRYASIVAKQDMLQKLEGSVSEGVVDLEKTIQLLEGFPTTDMQNWTEEVSGHLEGARVGPAAPSA